jgi:hypothetical protein
VETIPHGVVGYRCNNLGQFVEAVKQMDKIDPQVCRAYAEYNYGIEKIKEVFTEWFDSLYNLYESTVETVNLGWHRISSNTTLKWNCRYYPTLTDDLNGLHHNQETDS